MTRDEYEQLKARGVTLICAECGRALRYEEYALFMRLNEVKCHAPYGRESRCFECVRNRSAYCPDCRDATCLPALLPLIEGASDA